MSGEPFENRSYYFWKWADNDLPGPPLEVHAALLRGEMHEALQPFDARPLLRVLNEAAREGRWVGTEWEWQVHPTNAPAQARFVFVSCPRFVERASAARKQSVDRFFHLDLSGCDAETGKLIEFFLPKLNLFEFGQYPEKPVYDVAASDLPALIRRIQMDQPHPYAILTDKQNHFVQCFKYAQRFVVEWRENHDIADLKKYNHWRAGYLPDSDVLRKFVPPEIGYTRRGSDQDHHRETHEGEQELLRFVDTVCIFQSFLAGEPRPSAYHWRNINAELP